MLRRTDTGEAIDIDAIFEAMRRARGRFGHVSYTEINRRADAIKARRNKANAGRKPISIGVDDSTFTGDVRYLVVAQYDGEWPPFAIVQASGVYPRDPRMSEDAYEVMQAYSMLQVQLSVYEPPLDNYGEAMKYCGKCGDWQSKRAFSADKSRRDGLRAWCKSCESAMASERYHRRKSEQDRAA